MSTPEYAVRPVSRLVTPQSGEFVDIGMLQGFYNGISALTPVTDTLYAWPFLVDQLLTVSEMHLHVSLNEAGKSMRMGLYSDLNGRPTTLLFDSGSISVAATGDKSASISGNLVLAPGTYWAALVTDSTSAQVVGIQGSGRVVMPIPRAIAADSNVATGRSVAYAFAALPATFTAGSSLNTTTLARVELKIA